MQHLALEITRYLIILLTVWILSSCANPGNSVDEINPVPKAITTPSGLVYKVLEEGTGPIAKPGDMALIHEKVHLANGTKVTDTWEINFPVPIRLGGKQAIDGLDEAVTGMKVGERRKLIVPPSLSRRASYPDNVNPDDTLYYDVILLQVTEQ